MMEKKKYVKPSMEVYKMEMTRLICGSPFDSGYLPTVPGQHEDEKHLA